MNHKQAVRSLNGILEQLNVIQSTTIGLGSAEAYGIGTAAGIVGQVRRSMEVPPTHKKQGEPFKIASKRVCA